MAVRIEVQDGNEYRIVDLEGRFPVEEGIEFLYATKAWGLEGRFTPYIGVMSRVDGVEKPLGLNRGYPAFDRDCLWEFMNQPTRMAVLERAVGPIIDLLFAEGMFEGELEGLL